MATLAFVDVTTWEDMVPTPSDTPPPPPLTLPRPGEADTGNNDPRWTLETAARTANEWHRAPKVQVQDYHGRESAKLQEALQEVSAAVGVRSAVSDKTGAYMSMRNRDLLDKESLGAPSGNTSKREEQEILGAGRTHERVKANLDQLDDLAGLLASSMRSSESQKREVKTSKLGPRTGAVGRQARHRYICPRMAFW
ncbi:hypothetical protein ColTof4_14340 [Colletotrichum tofieldiae]|nr:hypothetical protein ColTof3_14751 [Colletotrichum tofieldiae]GKT81917.1 hypothetical protein ColTof4_14340 [Colletotrichum tofieldiae]